MTDEDFARAADAALATIPEQPRALLTRLAAVAADCPQTQDEIGYGDALQHCFWSLVRGEPQPVDGEEIPAEGVAVTTLLAMTSMDRAGHTAAADACHGALTYMATLPAWAGMTIGLR